ncbi:MAG: hypothetical protein H8E13_03385 [Actinobacteria bacterium]|nr:hypothetical protein [Actinomycetota bacterium]
MRIYYEPELSPVADVWVIKFQDKVNGKANINKKIFLSKELAEQWVKEDRRMEKYEAKERTC